MVKAQIKYEQSTKRKDCWWRQKSQCTAHGEERQAYI